MAHQHKEGHITLKKYLCKLIIGKAKLNGQIKYKNSTSSKGLLSELGGFSKKTSAAAENSVLNAYNKTD